MNATAIALAIIAILISLMNRKDAMDAIAERIEQLTEQFNAQLVGIKETIATETTQHAAAIQELKDLIADGSVHDTAALDAAFAKLESFGVNLGALGSNIAAIVPDEAPADVTSTDATLSDDSAADVSSSADAEPATV